MRLYRFWKLQSETMHNMINMLLNKPDMRIKKCKSIQKGYKEHLISHLINTHLM